MKRGGYTGDKIKEMKFRGSPKLYETIKDLAEHQETTVASVLRQLIAEALEQRDTGFNQQIQA